MDRPERPRRLISGDGKLEIIPDVEVFKVITLRPRSDREIELAEKYGPIKRILYSARTREVALKRAEEMIKEGHSPRRIQFQLAQKEILDALMSGRFTVRPVEPESS